MLTDLDKLKGFDFSKKIIYTDNLSFDELFFMNEKWQESMVLNLPNKMDLNTNFDEIKDINYKILYFNKLFHIYNRLIPDDVSKDNTIVSEEINCSVPDEIHIINNVVDVAISNNHIYYCPEEEYDEILYDNIMQMYDKRGKQDILKKYGLPISGTVDVIINRLIDNLTPEQLEYEFPFVKYDSFDYMLTDEGIHFVEKNIAYKYREYLPIGFSLEEFLLICEKNSQYSPEEILFCLCYQNWIQLGENSDTVSMEYKTEVGNINASYKYELSILLVYYHDLAIGILEKIIADGNCDDLEFYKDSIEDLKESYDCGNY